MERDSYAYLYSLHELQHQPLPLYKGLLRAPPLSFQPPPPQPPLLPLPAALPRRSSSCPARKPSGFTGQKKSTKSFTKINNPNTNYIPKKEEKKTPKISSTTVKDDRVDMLPVSAAVFAISPPPSSLPLPSFRLRPKLSCNAVAAGATDDLRRFLRLQ